MAIIGDLFLVFAGFSLGVVYGALGLAYIQHRRRKRMERQVDEWESTALESPEYRELDY